MKRLSAVLFFVIQAAHADVSGDWHYSVSNGEVIITAYTGSGGAVMVPAEIQGNPVRIIGNGQWPPVFGYPNHSVITITIPEGVRMIGNSAFHGCTRLQSVTIPSSLVSIGEWAFTECVGLTSITIPDSVTAIGWNAFHDCTNLNSVTIPDRFLGQLDRIGAKVCKRSWVGGD